MFAWLLLAPLPKLEINHFYLSLKPAVIERMRKSPYLNKLFAYCHSETVHSQGESWTGFYISGLEGYIEIYAVSKQHLRDEIGIGMLTTSPGGAEDAYDALHSRFGDKTQRGMRYYGDGPNAQSWFYYTSYDTPTHLNAWVMEYTEEFYRWAGSPIGSGNAEIMRAISKGKMKPRAMGGLRSLRIAVTSQDQPNFERALEALGWQKAGSSWRHGSQSIVLVPAKADGVLEARFSTGPVSRAHDEDFGRGCRLTVFSNEAVIRFR